MRIKMEFTGERFIPELSGDIHLEHMHRYEWCKSYSKGKRVLDIASGEGYGSFALAENSFSVIGVDLSEEAVNHAILKYGHTENLSFMQGNAVAIPLPSNSVDLVVSFETIEHHDQHLRMMEEIKRVLSPDGLVIISSPNKEIYSDLAGGDHNHFHIKELYFDELNTLLSGCFRNIMYYGQRVTATSLMLPLPEYQCNNVMDVYTESESGISQIIPVKIQPMYYIAICSNDDLPNSRNSSAFISEKDNAFYDKQREVLKLNAEIRRISNYIAEVHGVLQNRDEEIRFAKLTLDRIAKNPMWKIWKKFQSFFG